MAETRFAGRVVYVSGAGSGIGRATAQLFAREGAQVFAVDVNAQGLDETVGGIRAAGQAATAGLCDVASFAAVRESVAQAVGAYGGVDILVNAAGVGGFVRFEQLDEQEWQRVIGVNLNGTFHTMKAAIEHLLQRPGANIVNISSIAGLRGQAYNTHYSASKAGLLNLTRSIALEFASRGLRANCVCPGGVKTPLIKNFIPTSDIEPQLIAYSSPPKAGQWGKPDDIANAIAFLASDAARMINGAALVADFGTLA